MFSLRLPILLNTAMGPLVLVLLVVLLVVRRPLLLVLVRLLVPVLVVVVAVGVTTEPPEPPEPPESLNENSTGADFKGSAPVTKAFKTACFL